MQAIGYHDSSEINILIKNAEERQAYTRALGAAWAGHSAVSAIDRLPVPNVMSIDASKETLRGMACIAIGEYGEGGFGGLNQRQADEQLRKLSGDIDNLLDKILGPLS